MKSLPTAIVLFAAALTARADVIYTNFDLGTPGFDVETSSQVGSDGFDVVARAQAFVPDYGYFVTDVKLALSMVNTQAALPKFGETAQAMNEVVVALYNDNAGKPGQLISTFVPSTAVTSTPDIYTFVPATQPLLSIDIKYWLVAKPSDTSTLDSGFNWYKSNDFSAGETAEGQYLSGNFQGWNSVFFTREGAYEVNGIPTEIPEASTLALGAGVFALGLVLIRRRNRS
ncbi:MAG: choice-of-anchor R domain-containing protein [Verrucomicrobiota bacterium]|nr:choice-of-anchor R domain-containing protein [Verrucomicrobiota bacterium]